MASCLITTKKRSDDWIAYLDGDKTKWESGRTEAEAIGHLVITYQVVLSIRVEPPPLPRQQEETK